MSNLPLFQIGDLVEVCPLPLKEDEIKSLGDIAKKGDFVKVKILKHTSATLIGEAV